MTLNSHPAPVPVPDAVSAYLARTGLAQRSARVVPLTGDASDRRYFRVIEATGGTSVLALYGGPFEYETLTFVNVARLLQQVPLPVPAIFDHAGDLGLLRLQDLGDVTLQAHLGAVPRARACRRSTARRSGSSRCSSAAAPSWSRPTTSRTPWRSTSRS